MRVCVKLRTWDFSVPLDNTYRRLRLTCERSFKVPTDYGPNSLHYFRFHRWIDQVIIDCISSLPRVFILHSAHILVNLLHGHASTENGGHRQVAAVSRVARTHHVGWREHLLRQLRDRQRAVSLAVASG